jgi:type IV pilus assembly protein PilC
VADLNVTNLVVDAAAEKLPLTVALRTAAAESSPARRRLLLSLSERIEAGESIESALAGTGNAVPHYFDVLLRGASKSPHAGRILANYLDQSRRSSDRWRQLRIDLASPLVLCIAMTFIFIFVVNWIIPKFKSIFSDFGTQLPVFTVFWIQLSDLAQELGISSVFIISGVPAMILQSRRSPRIRWLFWKLPLIGPPLRSSALADFSAFLSLMVEFRTPLHEAVLSAADAADDAYLRRECAKVASRIQSGESPWNAVSSSRAFPATLRHAFRYATDPEAFREALTAQAAILNATAESTSSSIPLIVGPMIIMGTALFCMLTTISLFLPLVMLLNDLS